MIRLSRFADYGIAILTHMARRPDRQHNAPEIAQETAVPQPMASKILKTLAREGLLASHRGARGGYGLARPAATITVADIVEALDGPIALTACIDDSRADCEIEQLCPARANWQQINDAIRGALAGISLRDMADTVPFAFDPAQRQESFAHRPAAGEARPGRV